MQLWIRSQDQEILELITYLGIHKGLNDTWVVEGGDVTGIYKTKKRALKILDEIQSILDTNRTEQYVTTNGGGICAKQTLIYQMPKE